MSYLLPTPHQLPAATELCHCSGPLFINVSYTNNSSTFYTELPLQEYQTGVSIYSLTVENATECWRSYNVSVAYRSHTRVSRFSSPATLEGSEISTLAYTCILIFLFNVYRNHLNYFHFADSTRGNEFKNNKKLICLEWKVWL